MAVKKDKKTVSREVSLEISAICGKHFLNLDHLHYGYWKELEPKLINLAQAQINYAEFLASNIPAGIKIILDVGCGMGHMAKFLIEKGYEVDCVSPSHFLAKKAKELLNEKTNIYECFFEELDTEKKYDLVMFSESFQYIKPEESLPKAHKLLNADGNILICDVFKKPIESRNPLPGGFQLERVYAAAKNCGLKLETELDITDATAANIDIEHQFFAEVAQPVMGLVEKLIESRHPLILKLVKWKFRKKAAKIEKKYFSGERTGENFKKFKTYRLMLYKRTAD
ncbi:MAG: class I SAM-dependent methyltransferase [Anaerohalosphaeraceae bacterium]|nr:class I SAM-dependent methyltransferase [Anaerohalosphaeraceae bacterium]